MRRFAARGDRVWFLYEKNDDAAARIARETGATAIRCDVADAAQVAAAFDKLPPLDVLICNAGNTALFRRSPTKRGAGCSP